MRFLGKRAVLQIRSDRARIKPWGLNGGGDGTNSRNTLFTCSGESQELPSKIVMEIPSGSMWRHTTASGGGWGRAVDRSLEATEQDLLDGKTYDGNLDGSVALAVKPPAGLC